MATITTIGTSMITFFGNVISALFGAEGAWSALLDYFMIGIVASLLLLGIKVIRKVVWGS